MGPCLKNLLIVLSVLGWTQTIYANEIDSNVIDSKAIDESIRDFEKDFQTLANYTADVIHFDLPRLLRLEVNSDEEIRIQERAKFALDRYQKLTIDLEILSNRILATRWLPGMRAHVGGRRVDFPLNIAEALQEYRFHRDSERDLNKLDAILHRTYEGRAPTLFSSSRRQAEVPFLVTGILTVLGAGHAAVTAPSHWALLSFAPAVVSFGIAARRLWRYHLIEYADFTKASEVANQLFQLALTEKHYWDQLSTRAVAGLHPPSKIHERQAWLSFILGRSGAESVKDIRDPAFDPVTERVSREFDNLLVSILNSGKPVEQGPLRHHIRALRNFKDDMTVDELIRRIDSALEVVESVPHLKESYSKRLRKLQDFKLTDYYGLNLLAAPNAPSSRTGPHIFFDGSDAKLFKDSIYPHLKDIGPGVRDQIEVLRKQGEPISIRAESQEIAIRKKVGSRDPEVLDSIRRFEVSVGSAAARNYIWSGYVDAAEPVNQQGVRDEAKFAKKCS